MSVVHGTEPDHNTLRCPKCGNTTDFREFALRETAQPFTLAPMWDKAKLQRVREPDWDTYEVVDNGTDWPQVIQCDKCEAEVWTVSAKCAVCQETTGSDFPLCGKCLDIPRDVLKAKLFTNKVREGV